MLVAGLFQLSHFGEYLGVEVGSPCLPFGVAFGQETRLLQTLAGVDQLLERHGSFSKILEQEIG